MKLNFVFPNWWSAMAAVPSSRQELDWWAKDDGRFSRYSRLFRVWGDPTDPGIPPFFCLSREKHLVAALWENFSLFDPASTIYGLFSAAGMNQPPPATDVCWSWEYNLGLGDRQLDVVIHVRSGGENLVLVGEAKARKLSFDAKDLQPRLILNREQFKFADARRYFLLGDATATPDWAERGHGHLNWAGLARLQMTLCDSLDESTAGRELLRNLIAKQFAAHGISAPRTTAAPTLAELVQASGSGQVLFRLDRSRRFVVSAIRHLGCIEGVKGETPQDYLSDEPERAAIKTRWRTGCGGRAMNEAAYWRIPESS